MNRFRTSQTVVLDLDGFYSERHLLRQVLSTVACQAEVTCVSSDPEPTWRDFGIRDEDVMLPEDADEAHNFGSVLSRAAAGREHNRSLVISSRPGTLLRAQHVGLPTAAVVGDNSARERMHHIIQHCPDFLLYGAEDVSLWLDGQVAGWMGEVVCAPAERGGRSDRSIRKHVESSRIGLIPDMPVDGIDCWFTGRYFAQNDSRSELQQFSRRLLEFKRAPETGLPLFADILRRAIEELTGRHGLTFDTLCGVPARPGRFDRIGGLLRLVGGSKMRVQQLQIASDLLECRFDYGSVACLSVTERQKRVEGAFACHALLEGQTIVVVDDVCTTGATMREAFRALSEAGAGRVVPLVLGFRPRTSPVPTVW